MDAFADTFLAQTVQIAQQLERSAIEAMAHELAAVRQRGGRLFILGVGGGAAHASHAVNDFRKLAGIEAYAPTDNVSELTARTNDEGWETVFAAWLAGSRLAARDLILVFSVGGGDLERNISPNLVRALEFAGQLQTPVIAVVGRNGGFCARVARACVIVPTVDSSLVTPHTEAFQAVLWHLLVSHPAVQLHAGKWESTVRASAAQAGHR